MAMTVPMGPLYKVNHISHRLDILLLVELNLLHALGIPPDVFSIFKRHSLLYAVAATSRWSAIGVLKLPSNTRAEADAALFISILWMQRGMSYRLAFI